MEQNMTAMTYKIKEIAGRIRELREITGLSAQEMAERTGISVEEYIQCEAGNRNLSIAFLYRCTLSFGVDMGDLLEGKSPKHTLIIPPDFTRFHSNAGYITNVYYHALTEMGCEVDILPALGNEFIIFFFKLFGFFLICFIKL